MSNGTQYFVTPMEPGVRPADPPDYDGITFVYVFTSVLDPWIQPPVMGQVTIVVANNQGFVNGMTIVIEGGGYYTVVSTANLNQMTIQNAGTGYNAPPGTSIPPGKITTTSLPGPPGGTGSPGPTGNTGPSGPPGPPLNAKGSVASSANLPATGNAVGDFYTTSNTGHGWSWGTDGTWHDMGAFQGATGPQGVQGVAGPVGSQGIQGPAGSQGVQGPVGNTGPQGVQGVAGPTGSQGVQGPIGPIGQTGPQGPVGNTGSQGPIGNTGPQGPPGGASANTTLAATFTMPASGSTNPATVANASVFAVGAVTYIQGLGYLSITAINTGTNQLTLQNLGYSTNATSGTTAPSGTVLTGVGPQGPQGIQGATGATGSTGATGGIGPQGPQGVAGNTGATGSTGPAGAAATVSVGTTTTGSPGTGATVTNSGTSAAAVLNFTIPAGVAGATGAQGVPGATGSQGIQGLQGATGASGAQGATGPQGVPGPVGPSGPTAVSADAGNMATLGSDSLIYVQFPPGAIIDYAGATAPNGWLFCQGQPVSRATYSALYTALGGSSSPYGQGDGSTTFNLPDLRGRTTIGTGQGTYSGATLRALAATGGVETYALQIGDLAAHAHTMGNHTHSHAHTHTMGNHTHSIASGQFSHNHGASASDSGHTHAYTYVGTGGGIASGGTPYGNVSNGATTTAGYASISVSVAAATLPAGGTVGPSTNTTDAASTATTSAPSNNTSDSTGSGNAHQNMQPFMALAKIIKT